MITFHSRGLKPRVPFKICGSLYKIEPDTKLIVTVLPKHMDEEREDWMVISQKGLEQAYGKNEPEYSTDFLLKNS